MHMFTDHTHTQDSLNLDKTKSTRPYAKNAHYIRHVYMFQYIYIYTYQYYFVVEVLLIGTCIFPLGSILACILVPIRFQKQPFHSSLGSTGSACLFLPLDLAAAFGKWTFTACISLPNCVHTCLICPQICE